MSVELELAEPDAQPASTSFALRPYQRVLVDRAVAAVAAGRRPGVVLPTGGGKTAVMAGITSRLRGNGSGQVLVLQDRGALVAQNGPKLSEWLGISHSRVGAGRESWAGEVVLAMRQSAARPERLEQIKGTRWAGVLIDEAHRLGSEEYARIVAAIPKGVPVVGLSATLARADGRPLEPLDEVIEGPSIEELIRGGHLTPYRFLVPQDAIQGRIKRGVAELKIVAGEYSASDAARLLNTAEINRAVVKQTRARFLDRKERAGQGLVAFCSTIEHAEQLAAAYRKVGVDARAYHSQMSQSERDSTLEAFDRGGFRVLVNPLALGEGFDCARVGSVVILRPCAHRATFVQIVGRGLRTASKEAYPDIDKRECVVFDYAAAVARHRSLDCPPDIHGGASETREMRDAVKDCPQCASVLRRAALECPECGYRFTGRESGLDPSVTEQLVELALEASGHGGWLRVGALLYALHQRHATGLLLDLRDGTFMALGYTPRGPGAPRRLRPLGRAADAGAAVKLAERFTAELAPEAAGPERLEGRRLWIGGGRIRLLARRHAAALSAARAAIALAVRRYGPMEALRIDLDRLEPVPPGGSGR
jgi:superfamily II DNA or RNA helicase